MGYTSNAISMVHNFISDMLLHLSQDNRVHERLMSLLLDHLMDRYTIALNQAHFVLKVELEGTPLTLNHQFNRALQRW